jgi:UDP-glucose 4-epimerase
MVILVSGAHGFLGRNVARKFKHFGHYVVGVGHGKWDRSEYTYWGLDEWIESTITMEVLLRMNKKFDIVVHCGGAGSVKFSVQNPYEDFQKSVQSTLTLLEFIRLYNPNSKFIYPSSPAVQGNVGDCAIEESMIGTPVSPYGFHKKIAEDLCRSYHTNFSMQIGVIRFFSIYGPGLRKQLLWDTCMRIHNNEPLIFYGTGRETRDFIHVNDATSLVLDFANSLNGFDVINGGSGVSVDICSVVNDLCTYLGHSKTVHFSGQVKDGDPLYFKADIRKAQRLGWEPKVDLRTGLMDYANFFKSLAS